MKLFLFLPIMGFENKWSTSLKHQYEDLPFLLLYSQDQTNSLISSLSCLPDLYSFSELSIGFFLHSGQYFHLTQYPSVALLGRKGYYMCYKDSIPFYIAKYGIHLLPDLFRYLCSEVFAELLPRYLFLNLFFLFFFPRDWSFLAKWRIFALANTELQHPFFFFKTFSPLCEDFFKFWTGSLLTFLALQKWKQRKSRSEKFAWHKQLC